MGIGNFFKNLGKSKDPSSKKSRWEMAERISGKQIKYVTEKQNDVDVVIGKSGGFNIRDEELIVFSSANVVFRADIEGLEIWELLSKDGVVITGYDKESNSERTIIAHYVYYRK